MARAEFTIDGIHCDGCAANIEKGLTRLDGVQRASVDANAKVVSVRFDERRLDTTAVSAQLERLGFPVTGGHSAG